MKPLHASSLYWGNLPGEVRYAVLPNGEIRCDVGTHPPHPALVAAIKKNLVILQRTQPEKAKACLSAIAKRERRDA